MVFFQVLLLGAGTRPRSRERGIEVIDTLLSNGLKDEGLAAFEDHEGRGINAVEAPRGLLYYDYSFDEGGCITRLT